MKAVSVLLLAAVMFGAIGCENYSDDAPGRLLDSTKWKLTGWTLSSSNPLDFTITANFAEGRISGTSAVNIYGGPYTIGRGGSFAIGSLAVTEMAGPEPAMRAEAAYLTLLREAKSYRIADGKLTLYDTRGNESLIFEPASRRTVSFTGTVSYQPIFTGFFGIEADDGQKYEPIAIPEDYRVNGLRVGVTALVRDDMASINMYGTMIEIISIARL